MRRVIAWTLASMCIMACGLAPPQNIQLRAAGGEVAMPTSSDCPDDADLHEQRGVTWQQQAVTPGKMALAYAVGCGRDGKNEQLLRDGPWLGWYANGRLALRGSFRNGRANGAWEVFHDNGKLSARVRMAHGKPAALGEYFDRGGAPDRARTMRVATAVDTAAAYKLALERFPRAPLRMQFLQNIARLEFAASGAYISGHRPRRFGIRSQYFHLRTMPNKKCRKQPFKPSRYEYCKIFSKKCKKIWMHRRGSMVPGSSCRIGKRFYDDLRGVALRRTKCTGIADYTPFCNTG